MNLRPPPRPPAAPGDWEDESEELIELVERSQGGNERAFAELQHRYYSPLLSFARVRFPVLQDGEDVVVEILLDLHRSLSRLSDPRRFVGFLFAIARNRRSYELRRRRRRVEEVSLEQMRSSDGERPEPPGLIVPGPEATLERDETRRILGRAIGRLTASERECLLLHYQEQLSYVQIATMLDIPAETVRYRVRRARRRLLTLLPPDVGW